MNGEVIHVILSILVWGVLATLGKLSLMFASQKFGWSRMNWSLLVGTVFTGDRHVATLLGFLLNFFIGCFVAVFYFLAFALVGTASAGWGALVGLAHGAVLLTVFLPLLTTLHPRIASEYGGAMVGKRLEPPGFLALHYGVRTPLVTLAAHAVYGAVLGGGYGLLF